MLYFLLLDTDRGISCTTFNGANHLMSIRSFAIVERPRDAAWNSVHKRLSTLNFDLFTTLCFSVLCRVTAKRFRQLRHICFEESEYDLKRTEIFCLFEVQNTAKYCAQSVTQ